MVYIPVLFVFIPIISALIIFLIKGSKIHYLSFLTQAALIVLYILYVLFLKKSPDQNIVIFGGWDTNLAISFYNDRLSLVFIGLTIFMWLIIVLYTFKINYKQKNLFFFLLFLQGVFLGLLQTNDLFNLFVFLELTAVLVTILIVYRKGGEAFKAGLQYLLVNTVAAMFFLIGVILLYYVYGTINIRIISTTIATYSDYNIVKFAYVLMITGLCVKAALFPLFTWLPRAHGVAQASISALLSGLIVKAALYIFIRINYQMFNNAYQMNDVFFYLGAISALVGVIIAMSQKDLKQILAYHTVSQVGIIMMGLSTIGDISSIFTNLSSFGGLLHAVNHAVFKSLLFLASGVIIRVYQTKKVDEIRGVFKTLPWTSIVLIIAMFSITGAPFFNGFISKSLIKYDFKDDVLKMIIFYLINLGTMISFIKFSQILFGKKQQLTVQRNIKQHIAMSLLGITSLIIGLLYLPLGQSLFSINLNYVTYGNYLVYIEFIGLMSLAFIIFWFIIKRDFIVFKLLRKSPISFLTANSLFVLTLIVFGLFVFL
jgi:multicomponent Na+:H+ antiporter subunit D